MTEITVFRDKGSLVGFNATGHTGYAESGTDIVCAAVSAVTQTAVLGITELAKCHAAVQFEDGGLYLMLDKHTPQNKRREAELILGTMLLGLRSIQIDYSDYLKLIEREV